MELISESKTVKNQHIITELLIYGDDDVTISISV